jgi:serine/threonine protein phosphatase PrpC
VLHEIHDAKDNSVLIAGVMDGHGGDAASTIVSSEMPSLLSNELVVNRRSVPEALESSWETVCGQYRELCAHPEECRADYDPREGILMANTGGEDLVAGTTISVLVLDEKMGKVTTLNCGDSRSLIVGSKGSVRFVTSDHTPESEESRLREGIESGLTYSLPKCRLGKWSISIGAYEYAVARSLEAPFATSKGIVSDPDVTELSVYSGETLLSASDGLWEVMDSSEVALDLYKMRKQGMSASDSAKALCSMALKKGTSDNVSAVVVHL